MKHISPNQPSNPSPIQHRSSQPSSKSGVIELDENDQIIAKHESHMGPYFRLLRMAKNGNLLYTSGATTVMELKPGGKSVRKLDLTSITPESKKPYFIEQLADGKFLISTGYGATVLVLDQDCKLVKIYGGKGKIAGAKTL